MKVLIAGGGTAGHINPALAIAGEIMKRQPTAEIRFAGTPWGMEAELVPRAGYDFSPMRVAGFQRKISLRNVARNAQALWYLADSTRAARKIISDFAPDAAVGTGGYVSGPIMRQAAKMGVPLIIHEQNAFPGVTTKMLAKHAACICLASEAAKERVSGGKKYCITGNPIRQDILCYDKSAARRDLGIDSRPLVLSFGGSLGARAVNEAVLELLESSAKNQKFNHIHGYGKYGGFVPDRLREAGVDSGSAPNLDVREYINDMPRVMAAADLVICRAGAITISELEALGKPSILIPSPNVAENHQYHNAMELANRGAAVVMPERELTPALLRQRCEALLEDREKLRKMSEAAHRMAVIDAASRIYECIIDSM